MSKSHYDFSHLNSIYCFSDLEGSNPFTNVRLPGITCKNGFIESIDNNYGLVFLGDLIDHERHTITLLLKMLELKKAHPNNVILVCGNRDINKLRFADEAYIVSKDNIDEIVFDPSNSFYENVSRISRDWGYRFSFRYTEKELAPLLDFKIYRDMEGFPQKFADANDLSRLDWIYEFTMKATNQVNFMYENLRVLFQELPNRSAVDSNYKRVAVALANMIMSRNWHLDQLPNDRTHMMNMNGLYLRYLDACNVCATFERSGKISFVSHSGIPEASRYFTNIMAYKLKDPSKIERLITKKPLKDVVEAMNSHIRINLRKLLNVSPRRLLRRQPIAVQILHMSFSKGNYANITESLNPVLNHIPPRDRTRLLFAEGGGGSASYVKSLEKVQLIYADILAGTAQLEFNLYGHQPKGLAPEAKKVGETWHVCMDVSKIEAKTNRYSYAMLVIPRAPEEPYVIGRVHLVNNDKNIIRAATNKRKFFYRASLPQFQQNRDQGFQIKTRSFVLSYETTDKNDIYTVSKIGL